MPSEDGDAMTKPDKETKEKVQKLAQWIVDSKGAAAMTGAGASVESGIPDFRGKNGLWSRYDPEEYATIFSFIEDPAKVWNMLAELIETIEGAEPNPGHKALAALESMGLLEGVITQNVDSLHQKAGSTRVLEFHGHCRSLRCQDCNKHYDDVHLYRTEHPPRCKCGGPLRPDIVFFDEQIPGAVIRESKELASDSDLMLVIGTSAVVVPAAYMPYQTKANGGRIVEINTEATALTQDADLSIFGKSGELLPMVLKAIKDLVEK
jgi:NAD-dependent deacetylase